MDSKIKKLIEICRFEEDPNWDIISKLFDGVSFENIQEVLENRDRLIAGLIDDVVVRTFDDRKTVENNWEKYMEFTDDGFLTVIKPFRALEGFYLPEFGINITSDVSVYLGQGAKLFDVIIRAPSYISNGAILEHSKIQSAGRYSFIGENAKVSNVGELRGCFISGGPSKEGGRPRTYVHADSLNNVIMAAYTGVSDGTDTWNHPHRSEAFVMVDPETKKVHKFNPAEVKYRKLPIFIGLYASIGPQCLLNNGSIIGANIEVDRQANVDGMIYYDEGKKQTIDVRK